MAGYITSSSGYSAACCAAFAGVTVPGSDTLAQKKKARLAATAALPDRLRGGEEAGRVGEGGRGRGGLRCSRWWEGDAR